MGHGVCKIVINTDVKGQYLQTGVMMKFHLGSQQSAIDLSLLHKRQLEKERLRSGSFQDLE